MDNLVRNLGILGVSEGNGHPFSFSAIINGYSEPGLAKSGWPGIYEYVRRRHPSEFGIDGFTVSHAWTQHPEATSRLCSACRIPNAVERPDQLLGQVDGVIIARDDGENHWRLAQPFLETGLPVFIDKPLTLALDELRLFRPYLENGQLMSCSGMRYARELDETRANADAFGKFKLIRGAIVLDWERYGVHLLEAVLPLLQARPVAVRMSPAEHASATVRFDDGTILQIDALGKVPPIFRVDLFGELRLATCEITDNFSMFRRLLWQFASQIRSGKPSIPPEQTTDILRVLIAGRKAKMEQREISLDECSL